MKRREAKEEIERILAENIVEERVFQLKPWTCYTAKSVVSGGMYLLLGFTKVRYSDVWDVDEGMERAMKKAWQSTQRRSCCGFPCTGIARKMYARGNY